MGKRDEMKAAIGRGLAGKKPPETKRAAPVAAAATPKKPNPRSAAARDARAKARGRLPLNTCGTWFWDGEVVRGSLTLQTIPPGVENYKGGDVVNDQEYAEATEPRVVKRFSHSSDGVFRLLEELDVMFWEWLAAPGDEAAKAMLVFATDPPAPEPLPKGPPPPSPAPLPPAAAPGASPRGAARRGG